MDEKKDYLEMINNRVNESEDDLIFHIIMPMFGNELGYERDNCMIKRRSNSTCKITDILYQDDKGNKLIIEVKKPTEPLDKHLYQLTGYLNSLGIEWGILTNGYRWILINNNIPISNYMGLKSRIISDIHLEYKKRILNLNNFNLFKFESIFKSRVTNYYKLSQQYKVYLIDLRRKESSLNKYQTTINQLSSFLMHKYSKFIDFGIVDLDVISEFAQWCARSENSNSNRSKNKREKNVSITVSTVSTMYRYLNAYFNMLVEKGDITRNPLKEISLKDLIESLQDFISIEDTMDFSNIKEVLKQVYLSYESGREFEGIRNKAILSLMLIFIDRKSISNAKLSDFDRSRKTLRIIDAKGNSKDLELVDEISKQIQEVIKVRKDKGIKSEWLFCSSTGKKIKEESISTEIVNKYLKKFSNLTIEAIRQYTLKNLLIETKDVFSLKYMTGLDIKRLGDLLTSKEIKKISDPKGIISKHPFKEFLV